MIEVAAIAERFFTKVSKTSNCWLWTGYRKHNGYGQSWANGKKVLAHRLSYEIHTGASPGAARVLHHCDNPPCVNPAHLYLGTMADNMRDCLLRGRHGNTKKTHCPQGHIYAGNNLSVGKADGRRYCKACTRDKTRRYRERKAAR